MASYRQVGERLDAYIRAGNPSTQQIQGLLADLLAADPLLSTMREVASMPSFDALQNLAGSGGGAIQRDALLEELARRYVPEVLADVRELLDGLLDQPLRSASASTYRTDPNYTSGSAACPSPSVHIPDEYRSPAPQSGWDDFDQVQLPGWARRATSSVRQVRQRNDTLSLSTESDSHLGGIYLSDLAKEMKAPVGLLIQWCNRMGFKDGSISESSIISTRMALRIAISYRRSTLGLFAQLVIITMLVGSLAAIISALTR